MSLNSIARTLSSLDILKQQTPANSNPIITENIQNNIQKLVDRTPKPFNFIQVPSTFCSVNGPVNSIICQSPVMNRGQRGVVKDLNVNFSTVAGTVKISKINSSGVVLADIVTGISATTSGIGAPVLEEGEALAVIITTQAAGVLGVFCSGDITTVGV